LDIKANPSVFSPDDSEKPVIISIRNPTCAKVDIEAAHLPEWASWSDHAEYTPDGNALKPGAVLRLMAYVRPTQPGSGDVLVRTSVGAVSTRLLVIPAVPAFELVPHEIEIWKGKRHAKFEVRPSDFELIVKDIRTTGQRWLRVYSSANESGAMISRTQPLTVELELESDLLPSAFQTVGHAQDLSLDMRYVATDNNEGTSKVDIRFLTRVPPALNWVGANRDKPPRFRQVAKRQFEFLLANNSPGDQQGGRRNAALQIEDVRLVAPLGVDCPTRVITPLPLEIRGGASKSILIEADFDRVSPQFYPNFELQVGSNLTEPKQVFRVPVHVDRLEDHLGYLGIDLGSSNSCCAILEANGDLKQISLDDKDTACPTMLSYVEMINPLPETRTGNTMRLLASSDDRYFASKVDRIKQRLGDRFAEVAFRPLKAEDWVERPVIKATADYLRFIREKAQSAREAVFKRFILTHPAKCSIRQHRNLTLALKDSFGDDVNVQFVSEPVAALIPFFRKVASFSLPGFNIGSQQDQTIVALIQKLDAGSAREGKPSGYSAVAFDLGGGTTDITIIQVSQRRNNAGGLEIEIGIETSWAERFGGENLSDYLMEELATRARSLVAKANESKTPEEPAYQLAEKQSIGFDTPDSFKTEGALKNAAEELKVSWSSEANGPWQRFSSPVILIPDDPEKPVRPARFTIEELNSVTTDLKVCFDEELNRKLSPIIARLKNDLRGRQPDYIQLSGKTAFLPEVKSAIVTHFPNSIIGLADQPKECVVRGACQLQQLLRGREIRLVASNSIRTTSSTGLIDPGSQRFIRLIPFDVPIPAEGLVCMHEYGYWLNEPLVLWENLGSDADDRRVYADGKLNENIEEIGTWISPSSDTDVVAQTFSLRLCLHDDFTLDVSLVNSEKEIRMISKESTSFGDPL
jgi:hypothetical protein